MSEFHDYRKASRISWGVNLSDGEKIDREQIQLGAVLRIADATELMAKRHSELIGERDRFEASTLYWRQCSDRADLRNRALRGQITKLRNQLAAAKVAKATEQS